MLSKLVSAVETAAGDHARQAVNIGVSPLHEADSVVRLAQRVEQTGIPTFTSAEGWTHDVFVLLARVAAVTQHVKLAAGVVSVWGRSPASIAMAAVGLEEVSNGRFVLGLGVSSRGLAEGLHGVAWADPLRRLRSTVEAVRSLLTGGREQPVPEGAVPLAIGFRPRYPVPILIGALSPKSIQMVGELADCWFPFLWARPELSLGKELLSEGEARAEGSCPTMVRAAVPAAISDDPEASRSMAATWLLFYLKQMGPHYRTLLRERLGYRKEVDGLLEANADGGAAVLPGGAERLARDVTLMGTFDESRPRLDEWLEDGADEVTVVLPPWMPESGLCEIIDAVAPVGQPPPIAVG